MAVSDSVKVDLLLKKLYGVAKTDTAANKSPSNEAISSPLLIRGDTVWTQANSIPTTAATLAGVVQSYLTTSRIECVPDTTTQRIGGTVYPTWRTNLTNWIPPEFDTVNLINTYRVKVYYGATGLSDPSSTGGTQIFADGSGSTGEWYFDYVTGTLNLIGGTIPAGMNSSSVIYIYGYRYVGSTTINTLQPPINTNFSLTTTGVATVELATDKLNVSGDLGINGGDFTTTSSTFNLINANATTVNFAGAATSIEIGSATGTTNINNDLDVDGDVNIDGGDLTVSTPTFNLANTNATTINAFGAANGINIGNATTATITLRPGTLVGSNTTQDLYNTVATTVNAFGAATTLNVGNATTATITLRPGTLVGSNTTQDLYNTVATTVNFAGAATAVNIGDNTGTLTTRNPIVVGTQTIQNVYNTVATTVNAFGAATGINIGANSGTITIGNPTLVGTQTTQNVYNTVATTVNAFGAATSINIGAATGKTTIASTDNSTTSTTGALVISGGIGVANDIVGAGFTVDGVTGATTEISSIKSFVIDEGEY